MRLVFGDAREPHRDNGIWCPKPKCRRQVIAINARTGEVTVTEGSIVIDGPAGPLGNWQVICPSGHRFRVSRGRRR